MDAFKTCTHTPAGESIPDWRNCLGCIEEVATGLIIARAYMMELAHAQFNDNGDCVRPISEPVQGRSFQQIAQTALGQIT